MCTAQLCRATGPGSHQPPRAVQAGGTWPLPVSHSAWRGADSGCGPERSSLCISRRRRRRAQRPPVLAPWRRARAARVSAQSPRRHGCPARTHCPGEAGPSEDSGRAVPGQRPGSSLDGDAGACGRRRWSCSCGREGGRPGCERMETPGHTEGEAGAAGERWNGQSCAGVKRPGPREAGP